MDQLNIHKLIKKGFKQARLVTKKNAKTFYFASRFLNKEKRNAAYSVYAICRISDDAVDISNESPPELNLEQIKKKIESAYSKDNLDDSVSLAFQKTINTYNIPKQYFDELIEGIYMDLSKSRYDTFDELYTYCYRVAGVVVRLFQEHGVVCHREGAVIPDRVVIGPEDVRWLVLADNRAEGRPGRHIEGGLGLYDIGGAVPEPGALAAEPVFAPAMASACLPVRQAAHLLVAGIHTARGIIASRLQVPG